MKEEQEDPNTTSDILIKGFDFSSDPNSSITIDIQDDGSGFKYMDTYTQDGRFPLPDEAAPGLITLTYNYNGGSISCPVAGDSPVWLSDTYPHPIVVGFLYKDPDETGKYIRVYIVRLPSHHAGPA